MGFPFIGDLISGVGGIIDKLHTSDEERLKAKGKLVELQIRMNTAALDYETTLVKQQASIIRSETKGTGLKAIWRPITMLVFVYIIAHNYVIAPIFGMFIAMPILDIPPDMWTLLKIGLGGYVVGRSAEKIIPATMEAMKKKENV